VAAHVESWGDGAAIDLLERWAILVEDGHLREDHAWRYAYARECMRRKVEPRFQERMFA
jgi:hypothetical protein